MSQKPTPPFIKLNYFDCLKGGLHEGEVLNYVCIQKSCQSKGLICSVCKHDHPNHNVIPLKYLLTALKSHKQKQLTSQSFQSELEELEKLKNSFLYELKIVVEKFAYQIEELEEKIIEQFKQKKTELMSQIEMSMKFNEIIEETINNNVKEQQSFEKDFKILAGLVQGEKKAEGTIGNLSFDINLKKVIEEYENSYKSFSQKINFFLESSQLITYDLLLPDKSQTNELPKPPVISQQSFGLQPPNISVTSWAFSPTYKTTNITLSNNNKHAECNTSGAAERFALVDGTVMKKGSSIRFKIEKLKNWIGVGLAIKNTIVGKNYQFLYNTVGHGSYLLSSNGYSWSHSNVQNNLVNSSLNFSEGNIIRVQTNETELIFTNETLQNKVYKLPMSMNENEWKQACFCVNLTSPGDKVVIL